MDSVKGAVPVVASRNFDYLIHSSKLHVIIPEEFSISRHNIKLTKVFENKCPETRVKVCCAQLLKRKSTAINVAHLAACVRPH